MGLSDKRRKAAHSFNFLDGDLLGDFG